MKKHVSILALAASMMAQASHAQESDAIDTICGRADIECLQSDAGIVVGRPGSTAPYVDAIDHAAHKFTRYFGEVAPKAALVLGEVTDADIRSALRENYDFVLPWLTIEDRTKMIEHSVRAQVKRQRPEITDEALDVIFANSLKASMNAGGQNTFDEDTHQGVLAHELGHMFFVRAFWPDDNMNVLQAINHNETTRYAGPGPDWLDEMAAVLLENDALTHTRRGMVKPIEATTDTEKLWPMDDYFTMVHPAMEQASKVIRERQKTAEGRAKGGVVIMSHKDMQHEDGRPPVMFYAQSRAFADYMIEKTGNEQIFAEIARHVVADGTMNGWLDKASGKYDIPSNVKDLELAFHHWIIEGNLESKA